VDKKSPVEFSAKSKTKEKRPWGSYEVLAKGTGFQVKRLTIKPLARVSLQWHRHRDEHWVVARGTARATIDGEISTLGRGDCTYVARTLHHRVENISSIDPLEIIELQTGDYLGEDDIVRLEDDYGRDKNK